MKYLLLPVVFLTLFLDFSLKAQCPANQPLSIIVSTTTSSCEANGTITITPSGGGGGNVYSILTGPTSAPNQSNPVFNALEPGVYSVQASDVCGTIKTATTTVPGSYQLLDVSFTLAHAVCTGAAEGGVTITPINGLAPFEYYLVDGGVTTGPFSNNIIANLLPGTYEFQVYDACNNLQTRSFEILDAVNTTPYIELYPVRPREACNEFKVILTTYTYPGNGTSPPPYAWEVIASTDPGLVGTSGSFQNLGTNRDTVTITGGCHDFTMQVTNTCGISSTRMFICRDNPYRILGRSFNDCVRGDFVCIGPYNLYNSARIYQYNIAPLTLDISDDQGNFVRTQDSLCIYDLPLGDYTVNMTDACGLTSSTNFTFGTPDWQQRPYGRKGCVDSLVSILGTHNPNFPTPPLPHTYTFLAGPPNSATYPIVQYKPNGGPAPLYDVPAGTYTLEMMDGCGRRDTVDFTFTSITDMELAYTITSSCISDNTLDASATTINVGEVTFSLYDLTSGSSILHTDWTEAGVPGIFPNLTEGGVYELRYHWDNITCSNHSSYETDTITIPSYIQPFLDASVGIECSNGTGTVTGSGSGGTPPYTYELISGPITAPSTTNPVFTGLPLGTYDMRMTDDCNNSYVTSVTVEPFLPSIQGYDGIGCIGDDLSLSADFVPGATYSWTGPNGFSGNTFQVNFSPFTPQDTGVYNVTINVPGCSDNTDIELYLDLAQECGPLLDLQIILEGPYEASTGLMSDNLRAMGLIPTTEPYTGLGFQHTLNGGGETVNSSVFDVTGPDAIVDWVFVELRMPSDPSIVFASQSALLQADGSIVSTDGVSSLAFEGVPVGVYYASVKQRNHLAVLSPGALPLNEQTAFYHDFRTGSAFGTINNPVTQKSLGGGLFALFEADYNQTGEVNAGDRSIAWNFRNATGYLQQDSNFDGSCDAAERSQCWNNRNKYSNVPY